MFKIKDTQGWTDDQYIKLFTLMQEEPCLWNKSHPQHSRRDITDAAMKKISNTLNCEANEVQARWRSMRQTFLKYLQKEKLVKSGSAGGAKRKEWRFMSSLRFLQCEATEAGTTDNMDDEYATSNSEIDTAKEPTPKKTKKSAEPSSLGVRATYNKFLEELVASKEDEYSEKGAEIGNVLRRIAKTNSQVAQKAYLSIRRILLDAETDISETASTSQIITVSSLEIDNNILEFVE